MAAPLAFLASFVPAALAEECGGVPFHPEGRELEAAVLVADLSGFTTLAERLAERPDGAERLTSILNGVFGIALDVVARHGGAATQFAGDSTIAIWKAGPRHSVDEACGLAALCALDLQQALEGHLPNEETVIRFRVGVDAGRVWTGRVGGVSGRWEHVLAGPAVIGAARASTGIGPGQVGLGPGAVATLGARAVVDPLSTGGLLRAMRAGPLDTPVAAPPPPDLTPAMLDAFVPRVVTNHVAAGQHDWMAEFRRVSTLFVGADLPDLNAPGTLDSVQAVVSAVQEAVRRYEGSVNQVVADDKGLTVLAVWNLPTLAREDAATRAVRAATDLSDRLRAQGYAVSAGLGTGRAFCGLRGGPARREYAVIGAVVNQAARFMQAAGGTVLVDEATLDAASRRLRFTRPTLLTLKGLAEPVAAFRPAGRADTLATGAGLIGRSRDLDLFDAALEALVHTRAPGVIIFEGEAGIGKSALMAACLARAKEAGATLGVGAADAIETATPYFAWKAALTALIGPGLPPGEMVPAVLPRLASIEDVDQKLPLLNGLLPLALEETDATRRMTPDARADQTRELLVALIDSFAGDRPVVLALDDAHWFDSASWTLMGTLVRRRVAALLVLGTRPLTEPAPAEWASIAAAAADGRRVLEPLDEAAVLRVVSARLGVVSLPQPVAQFIHRKSVGNPFFSEQLAFALRDGGYLVIEEGRCRLAPGIDDVDRLNVPHTLEGVILGRVDALAPGPQLTLKVASVIGRAFRNRALLAIHPLGLEPDALDAHLEALMAHDLISRQGLGAEAEYLFRHVVLQDVVYGTMTFAQREGLHLAVAAWIERHHEGNLDPHLSALAHHWRQTGEIGTAIGYLERAASRAFAVSANEETARLSGEALALADEHGLEIDRLRRARWLLWHGFSQFRLGRTYPAMDDSRRGLLALGYSTPRTTVGAVTELLREGARQATRLIGVPPPVPRHEGDREVLRLVSHTYQRYMQLAYIINGPVSSLAGTLRHLNLTEALGPSPELGTGYALAGYWVGQLGLLGLARRYFDRGMPMVEATAEPGQVAHVCMIRGQYGLTVGDWEGADTYVRRALEAYRRAGDKAGVELMLLMLANREIQRARHAEARVWLDRARASLWPYGSYMLRTQLLAGDLILACQQQRPDAATVGAIEAEMAAEAPNDSDRVLALGLIAYQRLLIDGVGAGWVAAAAALEAAEHTPPTAFHMCLGLEALSSALIVIGQADWRPDDRRRAMHDSGRATRVLSRLARVAPAARAVAALAKGRHLAHYGSPRAAARQLRASLRIAEPSGRRYEAAHAHFLLGQLRGVPAADLRRHRASALELFAAAGLPIPSVVLPSAAHAADG